MINGMSDSREEYWNKDYLKYWKSRVDEANLHDPDKKSKIIEGDVHTSTNETYIKSISLLDIKKSDSVLEVGCGFGRSLSTLCNISRNVMATDISK